MKKKKTKSKRPKFKSQRYLDIKDYGSKVKKIYAYFSDEIWHDAKVLDVGSGTGYKGLAKYVFYGTTASNCTAIDAVGSRMAELVELGCKCEVLDLEVEEISIKAPGPFDIIICSHILEHVTQKCEDSLLSQFAEIGSNIIICYPERPKITKQNLRDQYSHQRVPKADHIVDTLNNYFNEVTMECFKSQIYITAKDKKNE